MISTSSTSNVDVEGDPRATPSTVVEKPLGDAWNGKNSPETPKPPTRSGMRYPVQGNLSLRWTIHPASADTSEWFPQWCGVVWCGGFWIFFDFCDFGLSLCDFDVIWCDLVRFDVFLKIQKSKIPKSQNLPKSQKSQIHHTTPHHTTVGTPHLYQRMPRVYGMSIDRCAALPSEH